MSNPLPVETSRPRQFDHLTDLEEAFCFEYVASGGKQGASALKAGYAKSCANQVASRLMRKPEVIRAIYDITAMQMGAHLPAALAKIAKLSGSAKSEYVQLEASKDLLDRAGLAAPKKVNVGGSLNVTFDLS